MKTKHYSILALLLLSSFFLLPSSFSAPPLRTHALLDANWRFHLGDLPAPDATAVLTPAYDDTTPAWKPVQLPHDYGLDVPYDPKPDNRRRGYLPPQIGWYRKTFHIPATDSGRTLQLEFGGIFRDAKIWLNGQLVATHPSGYTSFFVDITRAANPGAENTLVVRVDPTEREGWWYEGAGIYRHVYYNATAPLHVANYGTYIVSTVPDGNKGASAEAHLTIETTLQNDTSDPATIEVLSEILAPDGTIVATLKDTLTISPSSAGRQLPIQNPESKIQNPPARPLTQKTTIPTPSLWSLETPTLYLLRTTLTQNGAPIDTTQTTFGIRTIHFDPDTGFTLNGKHVLIQGAAAHQDMPAVGIAVPDSLQEWRVRKLQEMGANAWRMAHNPPNTELLDACDRLGMLVKAENRHLGNNYAADARPNPDDTEFPDLTDMIRRDRNHPSIILWSLSNEGTDQDTLTGERLIRAMMNDARRYDTTRPYTNAMNKGWTAKNGMANANDIIGVNYNNAKYDAIRAAHPGKPIFGSETANIKTTRGEYKNDPETGFVSNYNMFLPGETKNPNFGTPLATQGWPSVAARPWMAGSFKWTAYDYKGEPNPYGWPNISNNTGFMDTCGFPKDQYYYQKSCWTTAPMVHLMPATWNWPGREGKNIRVIAFANTPEVELLLNNQSLGRKPAKKNSWVEWQVPYHPGTLTARAYSAAGRLVATDTQETTTAPAALRLAPDRTTLTADNQDTIIVALSIHDAEGRLVPDANNRVTYKLTGGGRILGTGNGNPSDHDPDRSNERNAFHGYAIVLIQSTDQPATLTLTATSPGLKPATATLTVTK